MKLTIDNSASTENLIDFPIMVKLTPDRFDYSFAQVDGDDIRFVDPDGTALDYECDTWELDGDSWFWVRVPQIDATSTSDYIWMYYGTAAVGNGENADGVWNAGYAAVYHMNDKPGDPTQILDSTANGNTGTKGAGAAAPTEVDGLVGKGQQFVAANSQVIASPDVLGGATAFTIIAAYSKTAYAPRQTVCGTGVLSWQFGYEFADSRWEVSAGDGVSRANCIIHGGQTVGQHFAWATFVADNAQGLRTGIDDAISSFAATVGITAIGGGGGSAYIGKAGSYFADKRIDELRLSSVARSAEWIEAEYLSMWDSMLTYGDTEGMPEEVAEEPVVAVASSLLCVGVALAAVRQRHIILYLAAFIILLFLGFDTFGASLPLAIMAFIFSGYMLYSMSTWFWSTR